MITEAPKENSNERRKKNCVKYSRCMLGSCKKKKKKYLYVRILWTMCFEYSTLLPYSRHFNIMPNRIAWNGCLSLLATGTCQHLVCFFLHFCCPFSYRTTIRFSIFIFVFFFSKHICSSLFIRCAFGGMFTTTVTCIWFFYASSFLSLFSLHSNIVIHVRLKKKTCFHFTCH